MKNVFLFVIAIASFSAHAEAEQLEIHSTFKSKSLPKTLIVKFIDGRVGYLPTTDTKSVLNRVPTQGLVNVVMDEENDIVSMTRALPTNASEERSLEELSAPEANYTPTILASYAVAQNVLDEFDRSWVEGSQCYDRSHKWVYDEYKNYGTKMMKAFIFFSDDYIAREKFPWWFHTAPYVLVRMNYETTERIMDARFSQYPLKLQIWTDLFMKNKAVCKPITKYSEYIGAPHTDDCFLFRGNMFFWQPKDVEALERSGSEKKTFIKWEVDWSYKEGFGITR